VTRDILLIACVLLVFHAPMVHAQNGFIEKGSAAEARVLSGSGRDAHRILSAQLHKAALQREASAKATTAKDRTLIATIVAKLRANDSSVNYHFADDLGTAGVGAVLRVRPYSFVGLEGTPQSVHPSARVLSIQDDANAIVEYRSGSLADEDTIDFRRMWLHRLDMRTHADRDLITLDGYFVINGSQKYQAADGTLQTVLRLELINVKAYLDEIKRAANDKAEQDKAAELADREASFRKWTSSNGSHVVEALLSSYANGSVTLEMRDGKKVKVDVTKLSEADQAYVTKWRYDKH
jgi:hypothetical protein